MDVAQKASFQFSSPFPLSSHRPRTAKKSRPGMREEFMRFWCDDKNFDCVLLERERNKKMCTRRHNNKFDSALFRSWAGDLCLTNWTVSDEKIVTFFFRSGFCCCFPSFGLNASTRTHGGKQQSFRFSSEKGKVNKTNANDHDNGW